MLEICKTFFGSLNERGVRYCHWKSNSHLIDALNGKTDLDILVHGDDRSAFEERMAAADFKEILSPPEKRFPGFEDYLGFDNATGAFVHLHVHYCLIMGRKYIKNHRLPIEKYYFENLILKYGVKVPRPELELMMLIMRAHVKVDYVSLLKHAVKDFSRTPYTAFPADIESELHELIRVSDMQVLAETLESTQLPIDFDWCKTFLKRFACGELRSYQIWWGHYRVRRRLRRFRRNSGISVQLSYFRQFLANTRVFGRITPARKKTLPGAGRQFSVIGADGSGKSTLIDDLGKWLSWKLDTRRYYYGIPKDFTRFVSSYLLLLLDKLKMRRFHRFTESLFWLHVARKRNAVSRKAERDVAAGRIVITDRFPLREFQTMALPMDNPRIDPSFRLFGANLRHVEESFYDKLRFPDLAIVLQVHIDELRRRKSDLSRETHEVKANAVNAIGSRQNLIVIDANKAYAEVLLEVKRNIWRAI